MSRLSNIVRFVKNCQKSSDKVTQSSPLVAAKLSSGEGLVKKANSRRLDNLVPPTYLRNVVGVFPELL